MKRILLFVLSLMFAVPLYSVRTKQDLFSVSENETIHINNRILAKVIGKPISVIDVMKKMDMVFLREFPEYTSSMPARYQFYMTNWRQFLKDLIDKELILADAEENKMVVTNGDVRQEMESMFGPNIINNLDSIGMSYDEAWKIVKGDITIRRMLMYRVHSKAYKQISPLEIRNAFEQYSKENQKPDEWQYRVISIRDKSKEKAGEAALAVEEILKQQPGTWDALTEQVKALTGIPETTSITFSEEFHHAESQISPAYKEILTKMDIHTFAGPVFLKSRSDKTPVFRVFYLKDKIKGEIPQFNAVEQALKSKLLEQATAKESEAYLKRLRTHFAINQETLNEMVPEDFQPFSMH